jgi:carboxylesterase type B
MVEAGSKPAYWGDMLVTLTDSPVIMVSFNYRMGIFGFYSSDDAGANFGFLDQQMLLRYVRDNIGSFGGDPARVTIVGQSAGAMSVLCHLAAPASAGLFARAVAASPVGLWYRTPAENAPFVRTVAAAVGCTGANVTACLRSRPAHVLSLADIVPEYLFHVTGPCPECDNFLPWLPVVDGVSLPRSPPAAIRLGEHHRVPTIVSTMRNETLAFLPTLLEKVGDNELAFELLMNALYKDRAPAVKEHYARAVDTAGMRRGVSLLGVASTDSLMTCYARRLAQLLSAHGPTYLSTFLYAPHGSEMNADALCVEGGPNGAACHAGDVAYILPQSARMSARSGIAYQAGEASFALTYSRSVVAFATDAPHPFVPYAAAADVSTAWDISGATTASSYHGPHCDFFDGAGFPSHPWGEGEDGNAAPSSLRRAE